MNHKRPSQLRFFFNHFIRNLVLGANIMLFIVLVGIFGYHYLEDTSWTDSFTNAAMMVSGVGILTFPKTEEGKLFVGIYSVLGGATYLLIVGVIFSPIFHWLSRQIKIEDREQF